MYPNKEITLASNQPRIVPVVLNFNSEITSQLEFDKLKIDTNEIDLDHNQRVLKVSYQSEQEQDPVVTTEQTEQSQTPSVATDQTPVVETEEVEETSQIAVNQETQSAFGGCLEVLEDQSNRLKAKIISLSLIM